jgi:ketosteroid isomerase-like protein
LQALTGGCIVAGAEAKIGMSESDSDTLSPQIGPPIFGRIVAALIDRRNDPATVAPLIAPEADWTMNGDPANWAYAGLRCRRDAILDYLRAFNVEFQQMSVRQLNLLIEGEQACVQYETRLRHRGTGREALLQCLTFVRIEGDLVVEVHEFLDSALLFRLCESVER